MVLFIEVSEDFAQTRHVFSGLLFAVWIGLSAIKLLPELDVLSERSCVGVFEHKVFVADP